MLKIIKIKENLNIRLDKFIKLNFSSLTQSFIEKNIRKKNIIINNKKTSSNYVVNLNDELSIKNFDEKIYKNKIIFKKKIRKSTKLLTQFNESILFENNDFLILNKWAHIATQGGSKINISIDDLIKNISENYKLVHRLDKETSGLLIISKNINYARIFGDLFKLKKIEKIYIAICEGKPRLNESLVDLNIKNKNNKIENTKTYYKVLDSKKGLTQILFKPLTGKTHQLRIVSKNLGCPIIGDKKYNFQSKYAKEDLKLNAYGLRIKVNQKKYEFYSKLPNDFSFFIKNYKLKTLTKFKNLFDFR